MKRNFISRWLKDVPLSRKLYFTVVIVSVLILVELGTLWFSIRNLSAVRSYVTGESHWSKAQKDAVFYLREYATYKKAKDLDNFDQRIKVVLGDRRARNELEKKKPDLEVVRQGFREGLNHPDDIEGLIRLFRQFRQLAYIDKIIQLWTDTDPYIEKLINLRYRLEKAAKQERVDTDQMQKLAEELNTINAELTILSNAFNETLGEASRWVEELIAKILLSLTLTVELTGIAVTVSVSRGIERGVRKLLRATQEVSRGDYTAKVSVDSRDEIGLLGEHFNEMTETIKSQIHALEEVNQKLIVEKDRAENSEKIKQRFLANMSHEIRTPMNGILGFARLMEESELNPEQRDYLEAIIKSGDNLLVIINDILDFSKLESGQIVFEDAPFKLNELIQNTVKMIKPKAIENNNKVNLSFGRNLPEHVSGDSVRLNQILLNLLSNAAKFTENGSISLHTEMIGHSSRSIKLLFSVKDTGIGIPKASLDKIFHSFQQASVSTSRLYGGTGLGLSIVKQLVEGQGGTIWVESSPGEGSTFFFSLPFNKVLTDDDEVSKVAPPQEDVVAVPTGCKILVAEDNKVNQLLISKVLENMGFFVEIAVNGRLVIEQLEKNKFDLIIMDLQMPEMDGYETTTVIRQMKTEQRYIPIMAMTAHVISGEIEKCLAAGMNDFISKPFHPEELKTKIVNLISR